MAALNGKWTLDRVENPELFTKTLEIAAHEKEQGQSFLDPRMEESQEISINSKGVKIRFSSNKTGWNEEQNADFGVPVKQMHFGAQFTAVYKMVGDELHEEQDGIFKARVTRKVVNNQMVMAVDCGEAKTTRYYKRI